MRPLEIILIAALVAYAAHSFVMAIFSAYQARRNWKSTHFRTRDGKGIELHLK